MIMLCFSLFEFESVRSGSVRFRFDSILFDFESELQVRETEQSTEGKQGK